MNTRWISLLFSVVLAGLFAACDKGGNTDMPDLKAQLPLDSTVRYGKLDNGLTYYIKKNQKPENRAELRLVVNAGSILEDEDQQGLAHFTEHMMFNGTEHFAKNELIDFFELTGQKFGAHVNAYTSFDETVYMLKPRTDSIEVLNKGFQVLEDWAHLASFDTSEIDKERGVVIEEWRLRLGPENRMLYQYIPVLYYNSRYADRLPIGKKEILENFDYATIKRFYHDWYRPDLMAVVVVGDVDVDYVEQKIKEHFANLKNPENERERAVYEVPNHADTKVTVITDPEASFTNVRIMYKHPIDTGHTVGDYRQYLMGRLVSEMLSQRYDELKQQANPPFVYAYSGYGNMARSKDAYTTSAMVNEDSIMYGFKTLVEENQRMLQHGFLESELERAKKSILTSMEKQYNERDKMESRRLARELINNFLEGEPVPGLAYEYEMTKQLLPTIELAEVNELPKKWITDENGVIVITAPEKEGVDVPTKEEVMQAYKDIKAADIGPYEDNFVASELMVDATPGAIESEEQMDDLGVTKLTFNNGATAFLKPTDFKNDEILVESYSFGGTSLYPDEDYNSAQFITPIVMMSGIGDMSQTDLQKFLSDKTIQIYPSVGDDTEGMSGSTTPKDLETYLKLQYLYFTQPRKDETSFASFKQTQKAVYQNLDANPQFYFMKQLFKVLYNNHPRAQFPEAEDFDKIDLDKVFEIYRERFRNAGDFTFFIIGNFDIGSIKPLLEKYIGGLPSDGTSESFKDVGMRYPNKAITKELHKGTEPKSTVNLAYTGPFEWNYQNRFDMKALADVLQITLRESMREDQGGVYGVGVRSNPGKYPVEDYMFSISFSCSPENVEGLISTAKKEIDKLKQNGATDTDIKKVKETMLRQRETDMKENDWWANALESYHKYNEKMSLILDYQQYVNGLTTNDIKTAANNYLVGDRLIQLVMNPEEQ